MDKKRCILLFKNRLRRTLIAYRAKLGISQEKMAQILHISARAYVSLEKGTSFFSAWSLIFLLLNLPTELQLELLQGLCEDVRASGDEAA